MGTRIEGRKPFVRLILIVITLKLRAYKKPRYTPSFLRHEKEENRKYTFWHTKGKAIIMKKSTFSITSGICKNPHLNFSLTITVH